MDPVAAPPPGCTGFAFFAPFAVNLFDDAPANTLGMATLPPRGPLARPAYATLRRPDTETTTWRNTRLRSRC
jgi:hypothetical protein